MRDLPGGALVAESGVTKLHFDDGRDDFLRRTLRPGLRLVPADENRRRNFPSISALWNLNDVAGLRVAASFATRRKRTNSVINPSTNQLWSEAGRASLASVTSNRTARRSKSRIVEAGYQGYHAAQDCSYTAANAMIREFAPRRSSSHLKGVGMSSAKMAVQKISLRLKAIIPLAVSAIYFIRRT